MRPRLGSRHRLRSIAARRARAALWAASLLVAAGAARAAEPPDETQRWVPSFSVFFDVLGQKARGAVTSNQVLGPPLEPFDAAQDALAPGNGCVDISSDQFGNPVITRTGALCRSNRPNPSKIMRDDTGSDTSVTPLVGATLELMTPSPIDAWLQPRAFVHVDAASAFGFERGVAGVESPDEFAVPSGLGQVNDVEELSVLGQGSRARYQVKKLVLSAGGGLAFSVELFERRVRIKPSFEYLHFEADLIGVVNRAVKLQRPSGASDLRNFRQISLTSTEQRAYDGIGPGLELEVDTARLGPFVSSVYLMGRGYHLFGDLDTTLTSTNEFGESASWTIEPDSWLWRSGVGFRFRWVPEE